MSHNFSVQSGGRGEAGLIRLAPGLVRIPDVACISWDRLPHCRIPTKPIPGLVPNLAIQALSESNTAGEMTRKRREHFVPGVRLVWLVNPRSRTVDVYTSLDRSATLHGAATLDGGMMLPRFTLPLPALEVDLTTRAAKA